MRTQRTQWVNKNTGTPYYGIKVHVPNKCNCCRGRWQNYAEDGKAFLTRSKAKCERKRAELRKMQSPRS